LDARGLKMMDLLDRLLGHDAWTTRQLLLIGLGLTDEQLDREFDIAHRSVRATLSHIVRNVEVWSQLMAGGPAGESQGRSLAELIARFDRAAADLAAVARDVRRRAAWDERFMDTLDDPPAEKSLGGGIAHVVTHGMHHRAQLLYMLRRLGVEDLPEGDVLSWERQAEQVFLREVEEADLAVFFEHQRDPVAVQMAAFPPREREAFAAHWKKILADRNVVKRTVLLGPEIAGNMLCWEQSGKRLIGYWLGRRFWNRGVASRALSAFVSAIPARPLHARVAKANVASIRVLEKCGFQVAGESRGAAPTGGEVVDELVYALTGTATEGRRAAPEINVRWHNKIAWNNKVDRQDRWSVPVSTEAVEQARRGRLDLLLTPTKPVPAAWLPPLQATRTLCLASGGGQQGPLLAAAGAIVTVFDNSPRQLEQDRLVADRDGLTIETIEGDMADLSRFADGTFDFVLHPVSNCFVPDVRPVWRECFRVLRPGGVLLAGFANPVRYLFDDERAQNGSLEVRFAVPYSDTRDLGDADLHRLVLAPVHPLEFGHSLADQIGGQLDAGFVLAGFYEDRYADANGDRISRYMDTFIATRAWRPELVR